MNGLLPVLSSCGDDSSKWATDAVTLLDTIIDTLYEKFVIMEALLCAIAPDINRREILTSIYHEQFSDHSSPPPVRNVMEAISDAHQI